MAAVTTGLSSGIFLIAFYNGMMEQRITNAVTMETSHIQLHHPGFRDDYQAASFLHNGPAILQEIRKEPSVKAVTGRIILKGMITSPSGASGIRINGIEPVDENRATGLEKKIVNGRYFGTSKRNEMMIGQTLMNKLKLSVSHKAVISFQDLDGNIASVAFRITGVFNTENRPYDETNVFVRLRDIDSLTGLKDQYNEIAILLTKGNQLDETRDKFVRLFPGTEVLNWQEVSPELSLTVTVADQMILFFMIIILLALSFGIVNTMLMAILERTCETGILLALGMNRYRIFMMILLETLFLIAAGSPGGILLAAGIIFYTNKQGIDLSAYADVYASFGYSSVTYPSVTANQILNICLLIIITALVSSLFPAWKALRLKPAEAIRK